MRRIGGIVLAGVLVSCGGSEEVSQQQNALKTTTFDDSVAVSMAEGQNIVSELRADEEIVARSVIPKDGGKGTLELAGGEPREFEVPSAPSPKHIHEILHKSWRKIVDYQMAEVVGEVEYGCKCYVGSNPQIRVACNTPYCAWPAPYQATGGINSCPGCVSQSYCRSKAAACGKSGVYWACYPYWIGSYPVYIDVCAWW